MVAKTDSELKKEAEKTGRSVEYWAGEIKKSREREKKYRKNARKAVDIYEAEENDLMPYNILYSNTVTITAAIYTNPPVPIVQRRFKDKDPLGKFTSEVTTRFLKYFMDTTNRDYPDFDTLAAGAVEEALTAGRGICRFKYEAIMEKGKEKVKDEMVVGEEIPWNRLYVGYARTWAKVPWIALEFFMTEEEFKKNFPKIEDIGKLMTAEVSNTNHDEEKESPPADSKSAKLAHVYEIWDKSTRKVLFICPDYKDGYLKEVDDPLKLSGFYPMPRPLMFGKKISSMLPIPVYYYYERQANELNRITIRINRVIDAMKVRGMYDSTIDGIEKVLTADDNTLIPAQNVAALMDGKGLENSIWLLPIDRLVGVLQQLYAQRQQVKSIIQEISGIADIMRGDTKASETLGAQQMKNQWGGMRIGTYRKAVEIYLRDCLRIVAEIGFKHLSQETLIKLVNVEIPTRENKDKVQKIFDQAQAAVKAGQQVPPLLPEKQADMIKILSRPTWEDIIKIGKDDLLRNYKLDVETDSTVSAQSSEDKAEISEFMNALGQFITGITPAVQTGVIAMPAVKAILMTVVRRYKFGTEVEDEISQMQPPPPAAENQAAQQKMAADQQAHQQDLKQKQEMAAADIQLKQMEVQSKKMELDSKNQQQQQLAQLAAVDFNSKMQDAVRKDQLNELKHQAQLRQIQRKEEADKKSAQSKGGNTDATA